MQIKLGAKIRELRGRDGRRQEDLARAIGVTNQAVSRWETDGSYPDLELLPAIAHYFGVTIDELFGYESERDRKVEEYFERIRTMNRENNGVDVCMDQCVQFARESLAEFPEDRRLLCALASVLYNAGYVRHGEYHCTSEDGYDVYDVQRHRAYAEWQEAMKLYEKALPLLEEGPLREQAVRELLQLYLNTGEEEKAERLILTRPDLSSCRELLSVNGCDGKRRAQRYGEALLALADQLARTTVAAVCANEAHLSAETAVQLLRNALAAYRLVCVDENYGIYHASLAHIDLYLSEHLWRSGDPDGAFDALEHALRHARQFEALRGRTDAMYTAPLTKLVKIAPVPPSSASLAATLPDDWPWWNIPDSRPVKEVMQADPRWQDWARRARASE